MAEHADAQGPMRRILAGLATMLGGAAESIAPDTPLGALARLERGYADAGEKIKLKKAVRIVKVDAAQRLLYSVGYEPDVADAHEDGMTPAEVMKTAHSFMMNYAQGQAETGVDHRKSVGRAQLPIVESFIAPMDYTLGDQLVRKGTWVAVAKVLDDQLWKDVLARKYTGWSFEGYGRRVPA